MALTLLGGAKASRLETIIWIIFGRVTAMPSRCFSNVADVLGMRCDVLAIFSHCVGNALQMSLAMLLAIFLAIIIP